MAWRVERDAKIVLALRQCWAGMRVPNLPKDSVTSLIRMNGMTGCVTLTRECFKDLFGQNDHSRTKCMTRIYYFIDTNEKQASFMRRYYVIQLMKNNENNQNGVTKKKKQVEINQPRYGYCRV